ncbi:hypothetical protein GBA52_003744 [Prunus armeniaca]|nr:hypothetical protein GBA52_003744 [Prunus armeniaca]
MREKQERKAANRKDPRRLGIKRKKRQKFATAEERIKYKLEKARIKEALLIERLKRYEVPKVQGPEVKPDDLTGEERFYMKKMAQKKSNYAPIGKRGIFGGVILNMHMHWKKHETVKVICKPCKPGQVHEYAQEIARLSGGIPIQIVGDDTIVFYRGKNYVQPKVMSPCKYFVQEKEAETYEWWWSHATEFVSPVYRHWKSLSTSNLSSLCGTSLLLLRKNWSSTTGILHFTATQMTEIPCQSWIVQQKRPRNQGTLKYLESKN